MAQLCNIDSNTHAIKRAYKDKVNKGKFLYSAASSPRDRSKHFTLYFPGRPGHSVHISASLGSILLQIKCAKAARTAE